MHSCLVPAKALIRHLSAELTELGYRELWSAWIFLQF